MSGRRVRRILRPDVNPVYQPPPVPKAPSARRRLRWPKLILWLLFLTVATVVFWLGFLVKLVEVRNSQQTEVITDKIEAAISQPFWYRHLFWLPADRVAERVVTENPQLVATLSIKKDWLGRKLIVSAEDRQAVIEWSANNRRYGIDQRGIVAAELGGGEGVGLPQIVDSSNLDVKPGAAVAPAQFVVFVREVVGSLKLKTNLGWQRGRVIESTNELLVDTDGGFYLKLDTNRSAADQLDTLKTLLDRGIKPTSYVDLRLAYKVYYR